MRVVNRTVIGSHAELPFRLDLPDEPRGLVVCAGDAMALDSTLLDEEHVGVLRAGEPGQAIDAAELRALFEQLERIVEVRGLPVALLGHAELPAGARAFALPGIRSTRELLQALRPRLRPALPLAAPRFHDPRHAASLLAAALVPWIDGPEPLILGIPRTGALLAREVGEELHLPHDFLVVRRDADKTIAPDGVLCLSTGCGDVAPMEDPAELAAERDVVRRQERAWRGERPPREVAGRQVVLVDLALQTGDHLCTAATWAWSNLAASVIVAVPVGARAMVRRVAGHAGVVVCLRSFAELPSVSVAFERLERVTPASLGDDA